MPSYSSPILSPREIHSGKALGWRQDLAGRGGKDCTYLKEDKKTKLRTNSLSDLCVFFYFNCVNIKQIMYLQEKILDCL